ncbi:Peroxisomal membrane protein 4 [Nowakowskiella sp. JEL0078]|nr:Peroxisomal membrane protein 4 [Nowakowskiella sp. JEL0078]
METINQLLNSPSYHDLFAIIKGFRNGAVYGAKIRFPHALVMTLLFRRGKPEEMARIIFKATYAHARNLALFVTIYKTLMVVMRRIKGKENNADAFLAGLVGGYVVFGETVGMAKLAVKRNVIVQPNHTYPVFAAVVWGIALWLFRHDRDTLQPSLQASMHYLYNDSEHFDSIRNLLFENK